MQSIVTASKVASSPGSHVFVLDCQRKTERLWSEYHLARGIPETASGYHLPSSANDVLVKSSSLPASSAKALKAEMDKLQSEGKGVIGDPNALLPLWTAEGVAQVLGKRENDPFVGTPSSAGTFRLAEKAGKLCHFVRE